MDAVNLFPAMQVMWTRYSAYEVSTYHDVEYIVPALGAEPFSYNCAEHLESLVADALELGRQIARGTEDDNRLCTAFAARYGLLGLGAGNDAGLFAGGDVAPVRRVLNSAGYGEPLDSFKDALCSLYQSYEAAQNGKTASPQVGGSLRFRLLAGHPPQVVWTADSLLDVMRLGYAALISAPGNGLKTCKNCGRVYYNTHVKSEFCGTRCRNYYNVKAFRANKDKRQTSML